MKLGLKIWSSNLEYILPANKLFEQNVYDYVELFTVPGSTATIREWKKLKAPRILHAPHSHSGLNPASRKTEVANFALVAEVEEFRRALKPDIVIFHPGVDGPVEESVRQFCEIRRLYPELHDIAVVENKPQIGMKKELCVGYAPQEISRLMNDAGLGFCLDIGHAICAANSASLDPFDVLRDFLRLRPVVFHMSDGWMDAVQDAHLNFGCGNYDLATIFKMLPENPMITIETQKAAPDDLTDFVSDVIYLRKLEQS